MNSNCEKIEENKMKLTIEVNEEKVEEALQKAYNKLKNKIDLPGFRKGKVPRKILETKFGPEVLYEDALEYIVPHAYRDAVMENEIEPVDQPEIDVEQMEKGKPLKFTATVVVKPQVKLGEYKGLEAEVENVEITEEDIEAKLKDMQEKHAEFEKVDDTEAEIGDRLVVDFKGYKDGEVFEGGHAENYNIELGAGQLVPGFEDQLVGSKPGDEKEVNVTMPEDYGNEELAGQKIKFDVKVNEIKKKKLLPLDDDFAKDVGEFDTLEELREDIKKYLEESEEEKARNSVEEQVVNKATENAEVDIPETMIDQEMDRMVSEFEQNLRTQGLDIEQYYKFAGTDKESFKEQFKTSAQYRVKTQQVLEAILQEEGIEAEENEVEEEINKIAKAHNQEPEQIRTILQAQGQIDMLKQEKALRKVVEFLVDQANVIKVDPVDKNIQEEDDKEGESEQDKKEKEV